MPDVCLRAKDGRLLPISPARWHGRPTRADELVLRAVEAPVLDVGCGPGRVLDLLAQRGATVLGVDPAPGAVSLARGRGCAVLQRSVFDRLPLERRWGTVLLLDGNVGIGGDPVRLLARCRELVAATGTVLLEVDAPPTTWRRCLARLERGTEMSAWFPWAVVGVDGVDDVAARAGLEVRAVWEAPERRWFAVLGPQ